MNALKSATPILFVFTCLPFLFALSGCGVKPDNVDAPASVQNDTFPNTYPDAATDLAQ